MTTKSETVANTKSEVAKKVKNSSSTSSGKKKEKSSENIVKTTEEKTVVVNEPAVNVAATTTDKKVSKKGKKSSSAPESTAVSVTNDTPIETNTTVETVQVEKPKRKYVRKENKSTTASTSDKASKGKKASKPAKASAGDKKKKAAVKKTAGAARKPASKETVVQSNEKEEVSESERRFSYKLDKYGHAYRTYRLVSFDNTPMTTDHSATQNTKKPVSSSEQNEPKKNGFSFGLGPRNAACKMLTSICAIDKKKKEKDPSHVCIDVINQLHTMEIKETTRGSKQRTFRYIIYRVPGSGEPYPVHFTNKVTGAVETKNIQPMFKNKLYALENHEQDLTMSAQEFNKKMEEKKEQLKVARETKKNSTPVVSVSS